MINELDTARMIPLPGDIITIREANPTDTGIWSFDRNGQLTCLSPSERYCCVLSSESELLLVGPGRRLLHIRDGNLASLLQRIKCVSVPAPHTRVEEDWTTLDAAYRLGGITAADEFLFQCSYFDRQLGISADRAR
jgi:hypothetical protein